MQEEYYVVGHVGGVYGVVVVYLATILVLCFFQELAQFPKIKIKMRN
jgi:hypothetical protein